MLRHENVCIYLEDNVVLIEQEQELEYENGMSLMGAVRIKISPDQVESVVKALQEAASKCDA